MPTIAQPGTYPAKVIDAGLAESETNRTPSVKLKFEAENGGHIYWDGWLTDAAFENTVKTLHEAFGFNGDFNAVDSLIGQHAQIVCQTEEYEGQSRIRVRFVNHKDGRKSPMLEGEKKQSFADKFTAKARDLIDREKKSDAPF